MSTLDLAHLPESGSFVQGDVVLSAVESATTRNGNPYIKGTLRSGEVSLAFKAWGDSDAYSSFVNSSWVTPFPVSVQGKVDDYQGTRSILVSSFSSSSMSLEEICPVKYPAQQYWQGIVKLLSNSFNNPASLELWLSIVEPHRERFTKEFAGAYMHDAVTGGLLGHSFKTSRILGRVLAWYPQISESLAQRDADSDGEFRNSQDLLMFAMAMHDLGKIWEYSSGTFSEISWASHRVLLNEYLTAQHRDALVEHFGSSGYLRLLAALAQHHGEYEERPRTVEGYLLHLVDAFETNLTQVSEGIVNGQSPFRQDSFRIYL